MDLSMQCLEWSSAPSFSHVHLRTTQSLWCSSIATQHVSWMAIRTYFPVGHKDIEALSLFGDQGVNHAWKQSKPSVIQGPYFSHLVHAPKYHTQQPRRLNGSIIQDDPARHEILAIFRSPLVFPLWCQKCVAAWFGQLCRRVTLQACNPAPASVSFRTSFKLRGPSKVGVICYGHWCSPCASPPWHSSTDEKDNFWYNLSITITIKFSSWKEKMRLTAKT